MRKEPLGRRTSGALGRGGLEWSLGAGVHFWAEPQFPSLETSAEEGQDSQPGSEEKGVKA